MLATDFFTLDLLEGTSAYVLAVIEHATGRIRILGMTAPPDNAWPTQQARNLLMDLDAPAESIKFQIRDRDTKSTAAVDAVFTTAGTRILRSPTQTPRANPITQRWIGSCRRDLLDQTLIRTQRHLLKVLREYQVHHHEHRPHRTLNQAAPLKARPAPVTDLNALRIHRHNRTGGIIHEYTPAA
jgi:putative transposase